MRAELVPKDKVFALSLPHDQLLITEDLGGKIIVAFSLAYSNFNRMIRGVANQEFTGVHLQFFDSCNEAAAAASSSDDLSERAPVKITIERTDSFDQLDERDTVVLEEVMMGHDQAGFPEEK